MRRERLRGVERALAVNPSLEQLMKYEDYFTRQSQVLSRAVDYVSAFGLEPIETVRRLAEKRPVKVIDVGGTAQSAFNLLGFFFGAKHAVSILNVNPQPPSPFVRFVRGSAMQLPQEAQSADVIISRLTAIYTEPSWKFGVSNDAAPRRGSLKAPRLQLGLMYAPHPLHFLELVRRALSPGGVAFVGFRLRTALNFHLSIKPRFKGRAGHSHVAINPFGVLQIICRASGWRITRVTEVPAEWAAYTAPTMFYRTASIMRVRNYFVGVAYSLRIEKTKPVLKLLFRITSLREVVLEEASVPVATYAPTKKEWWKSE